MMCLLLVMDLLTLLHPRLDTCREQLTEAGIRPKLRTVLTDSGYVSE